MNNTAIVEGQTVKVGDWVCFKSDVEQSGKITMIRGKILTLENPNGFEGDYIGGETTTAVMTSDCWLT